MFLVGFSVTFVFTEMLGGDMFISRFFFQPLLSSEELKEKEQQLILLLGHKTGNQKLNRMETS